MPRKSGGYVGDCSAKGIAKKTFEIAKKSNAQNPIKTGNKPVDFIIGKIPLIKRWNQGYNLGKAGFIAQQTYKETCKRKKK